MAEIEKKPVKVEMCIRDSNRTEMFAAGVSL